MRLLNVLFVAGALTAASATTAHAAPTTAPATTRPASVGPHHPGFPGGPMAHRGWPPFAGPHGMDDQRHHGDRDDANDDRQTIAELTRQVRELRAEVEKLRGESAHGQRDAVADTRGPAGHHHADADDDRPAHRGFDRFARRDDDRPQHRGFDRQRGEREERDGRPDHREEARFTRGSPAHRGRGFDRHERFAREDRWHGHADRHDARPANEHRWARRGDRDSHFDRFTSDHAGRRFGQGEDRREPMGRFDRDEDRHPAHFGGQRHRNSDDEDNDRPAHHRRDDDDGGGERWHRADRD